MLLALLLLFLSSPLLLIIVAIVVIIRNSTPTMANDGVTSNEILRTGLMYAGFDLGRQHNVQYKSNVQRFKQVYGPHPDALFAVWTLLRTTNIPAAQVDAKDMKLQYFLMTFCFLKLYKYEGELAGMFKVSEKTARKWVWFFAQKIAALKPSVIVWPGECKDDNGPVFVVTVDGTHCPINEPKHPTLSKNKEYYSHKFNMAGLSYELGLHPYKNQLVWMAGPFPAGHSDLKIFRERGLKDFLKTWKKMGIADNGYRGEAKYLSVSSPFDSTEVREFKARCKCRQETFNSRVKRFNALSTCFHHGIAKHKVVMEAVCVICQVELENGAPLYDV